jgi:hypothetical protein
MRKIEQKEFVSQFDIVDWNLLRFHQTLQTEDLVRLIKPYSDLKIGLEQQKKIIERFYEKLIIEVTKVPFLICQQGMFYLQVIEKKNVVKKKIVSK